MRFTEFEGEWVNKKLGQIYKFKITNSLSRADLNYENGSVKNIHYGDIHTQYATLFDITKESVPYINHELNITKYSDENYCQEGDLIFADASEDYNDIGKCIEIVNLNNEKVQSGLHTLLARPEKSIMAIGFAGYLMKSGNVKLQIQREAQGTKVLSITSGRLSKIELIFPALPEQQKIASFFTAIDQKISQLKRKKTLLEQYKKGVMQKIFSQEIRFKDDNGQEFPKWEKRKIRELFRVTRGNVLATNNLKSEKEFAFCYPVYSSQTTNNGLLGYYNDYLFEDCITWTTDGANAGDVNYRKGKFYCTNVCGVLESKEGYANQCIAEILNSIAKRHVAYVGNPKLMNNVMAGIEINIPASITEQIKISNFLSAIDDKINHTQKQVEKAEVWKKGLMQQMFC